MSGAQVESVKHVSENPRGAPTVNELQRSNCSAAADTSNQAQASSVAIDLAYCSDPFSALGVTSPGVALSLQDFENYHQLSSLREFLAEQPNHSR